jgi:hypothetical protein
LSAAARDNRTYEPGDATHRRVRAPQRVMNGSPARAPAAAVARREALQQRGWLLDVRRDARARAVAVRVHEGRRRAPQQPVAVELERDDRRRGSGQRM